MGQFPEPARIQRKKVYTSPQFSYRIPRRKVHERPTICKQNSKKKAS